jgi:hypothetical protein
MRTLLVALGVTLVFSAAAAAGTATGRSRMHPGDEKLTVSRLGTGPGTVTSNPAGIDCPTVCSAQFAPGTPVFLHPKSDSRSTFDGFSWNCPQVYPPQKLSPPPGLFPECSIFLEADASVRVIFNLVTTPCLVPQNRGRTPANAAFRLELASCHPYRANVFHYAFSRTIRKGLVLFQKPRSGTRLAHGARVDLVISKGRRLHNK